MKRLAILLALGGSVGTMLTTGGCATPAYTPKENVRRVAQNWDYEFRQAAEDSSHILLLTPASKMSVWNVRTPE